MISKQITKYRYNALQEEKELVNKELEKYLEEQRIARAQGDLSENEEYSAASNEVKQLRQRLIQITDDLADVEILEVDKGPRISLGCKVRVTEISKEGSNLAESREFHIDEKGDTITSKVLGINSILGKAILNGTSGKYKIQADAGTLFYDVQKIIED